MSNCFHIFDLRIKLSIQEFNNNQSNVAGLIGIADQIEKCWKFAIYVGNQNLLILFEKGKGVNKAAFEALSKLKPLNKQTISDEKFDPKLVIEMGNVKAEDSSWNEIEFFLYKTNLVDTSTSNKVKPEEFLETLKFNLAHVEHLEEGDIIAFDRSFYQHHAVLTDSIRMMVTHRYGEPENLGAPLVISASLFGMPTEKAFVTEDFLIEIADYRKFTESNERYDSRFMPRTREEIVREAKSRIGERGYSIRNRNCQNFASVCRNGTSYSPEVEGVLDGIKYGAATLATGLLAGIGLLA